MGDIVTIEIVSGVEGASVYMNDYRIAGNKPWGGGRVTASFTAGRADICRALKIKPPTETKTEGE